MVSRIGRTLWVRVVLYAVLGVLAAGAASLAGYLPMGLPLDISVDAIDSLLSVLSSSMLAVTTFSIGSLMTAYGSATSNGTPRATTLLAEGQPIAIRKDTTQLRLLEARFNGISTKIGT